MPDNIPSQYRHVIELDRSLRKNVAEYFFALNDMKDPERAVELLAGHVAIMVEMINELKKKL
ncbi:MAG TPA: hypothetical protein PK906_03340 [Spirochaetota bacterium]|nr:hypothetical protein [Spirochaetota bacterium]